ncbi:RICIN domain-containing protein [Streptomyces sp. TRM64462]|uniref:RICIN domain-containing protein n=1 Tax=Streptomyces sp. TRM64462 TaxID=2741726 RepID=UPI001586C2F5|nr:RICIN domain-containing protein [Streptomyces sp. TRM64462]
MNRPPRPEQQMWDPDATEVIAPLEATRALPHVEAEAPPPGARAERRRARGGPPRAALVAAGIVVCAAVGLGIGALLGAGDGGTAGPVAQARPTAATTATTAAASEAAPTPSSAPTPSTTPTPTPAPPPVPTGAFVLVDPATGRAADVQGVSLDDGAPVIAWQANGQPNQRWQLTDLGDGHVRIQAAHSGLCLQGADPVAPGAAVVQRACADGAATQSWQPLPHPAAPGTQVLALKGTGLVLAPAGPDAGAPVQLQQPDPANPPSWALQPVA